MGHHYTNVKKKKRGKYVAMNTFIIPQAAVL